MADGRERRIPERAVNYWQARRAELGDRATIAALDLHGIESEDWSHRFLVAIGDEIEDATLLLHGTDFGRLLDMPPQKTPPLALKRKLPPRFREVFFEGCGGALKAAGAPVRREGTLARADGRQEQYRAVFISLEADESTPVRFVWGAFSCRVV
jgi:hypothetical protein